MSLRVNELRVLTGPARNPPATKPRGQQHNTSATGGGPGTATPISAPAAATPPANPARHGGAAVPSPPRRAAARNPGAPRRDPEAVTEDSAAAKPARVTGSPERTRRARDRTARSSLLVPVTGHSQGQTGIPPNRTHPSMTQRPVQPADSPDDAHITQIRKPHPGTLGNMNWRQNGGSSRVLPDGRCHLQ